MQALSELLGLEVQELTRILVLSGIFLVGLVSLRVFLKLAMSVVRMGCAISLFIVVAIFVMSLLN